MPLTASRTTSRWRVRTERRMEAWSGARGPWTAGSSARLQQVAALGDLVVKRVDLLEPQGVEFVLAGVEALHDVADHVPKIEQRLAHHGPQLFPLGGLEPVEFP